MPGSKDSNFHKTHLFQKPTNLNKIGLEDAIIFWVPIVSPKGMVFLVERFN